MKKYMLVILAAVLCLTASVCFAGDLVDVRIGIHANEGGSPLAACAIEQGYFEEEGINPIITIVESGPSEMAAMRADNRTLDCGFIGAGVSWNAMDPTGNELKFVFLDNLSNSEALIARKGVFTDANGDGWIGYDELYAGLKGQTVYIDTATTPGGWFKDLLKETNAQLGLADEEKLWIYSETADYMAGYEAPNSNEEYKIYVIQLANENVPAAMSTAGDQRVDIAACYAPVNKIVVNANADIEQIATTETHLPNVYFPSTWVASQKWIEENPEAAQHVVNALLKGAVYRSGSEEQLADAMRAGENLAMKPEGIFDSSAGVWPTLENYQEWFKDTGSKGYGYLNVLYNAKKVNVPEGVEPKAFEDCLDLSFLLNAIENWK